MKNNRLLSLLLALLLILTAAVDTRFICAEDNDFQEDDNDEIVEENVSQDNEQNMLENQILTDSGDIPSCYLLEENIGVTSPKDQYDHGTSWAFAALGSAESTYLKAHNEVIDLSELQLAWFTYHNKGIADKLGLITNDGGEFDLEGISLGNYGEIYTNVEGYEDAALDIGGDQDLATINLSSGLGLIDEADCKYPEGEEIVKGTDKVKADNCYRSSYRLVSSDIYNMTERDKIKKVIMDKGALAISFYWRDDYYISANNAYYFYDYIVPSPNHSVIIVGWDDNFAKSNFNYVNINNDGAWKVKDSWSHGADGNYFWISYEDKSLSKTATLYTIEKINEDNNYDIYQYDAGYYSGYYEDKQPALANVFKAQTNLTIEEVGIDTYEANTLCRMTIYKNIIMDEQDDPTWDEPIYGEDVLIENPGYHTIKLGSSNMHDDSTFPIKVDKDKYFSVVVLYEHTDGSNVKIRTDMKHDYLHIGYSDKIGFYNRQFADKYNDIAVESYFESDVSNDYSYYKSYNDLEFTKISSLGEVAKIKAITKEIKSSNPEEPSEDPSDNDDNEPVVVEPKTSVVSNTIKTNEPVTTKEETVVSKEKAEDIEEIKVEETEPIKSSAEKEDEKTNNSKRTILYIVVAASSLLIIVLVLIKRKKDE